MEVSEATCVIRLESFREVFGKRSLEVGEVQFRRFSGSLRERCVARRLTGNSDGMPINDTRTGRLRGVATGLSRYFA